MICDTFERWEILIFEDIQEKRERLLREKIVRKELLDSIEDDGYCEGFGGRCDNKGEWVPAMTAYHWNIEKEPHNPNRPVFLCKQCGEEYTLSWQDRWDDYYSGLL